MLMYILRRLLGMIPLMVGITLISFLVIQLAPGGPFGMATDLNPKISAEAIERMRAAYHLNEPLYTQYWLWLKDIAQLNFGTSFNPDGLPVLEKITTHLPVTLWMNIIGLVLVFIVSIPIGVASARYQNTGFDRAMTVAVFIGFAIPGFWLGLLGMLYFGVEWELLPISGIASYGSEAWPFWQRLLDWGHHLILPLTIGLIGSVAGLTRYMRSSMLDVIRQDYITTARAKGLPEHLVIYRHGLRNALMPVVTILGLSIPGLIGGSVITESLFSINGMGKLFYDGVMQRDYPLIMGILTIGAFLTLLGNFLADLAYALVDPRVRVGKQQ